MNMAVQKNHRIVVGAVVAVVAAIGAGVLAVQTHRQVELKSAATAPMALPDTAVPDVNQNSQTAPPPPMAEGTPMTGAAAAPADAPATTAESPTAQNPQPVRGGDKAPR